MSCVLTFNRVYLLGYQGAPVSLANMISSLGREISYSMITSDRDINDDAPYPQVSPDTWIQQAYASVLYLNRTVIRIKRIAALVKDFAPDVLYLNSFVDTWFSLRMLVARKLQKLPSSTLVLAPLGKLSASALVIKPLIVSRIVV